METFIIAVIFYFFLAVLAKLIVLTFAPTEIEDKRGMFIDCIISILIIIWGVKVL